MIDLVSSAAAVVVSFLVALAGVALVVPIRGRPRRPSLQLFGVALVLLALANLLGVIR